MKKMTNLILVLLLSSCALGKKQSIVSVNDKIEPIHEKDIIAQAERNPNVIVGAADIPANAPHTHNRDTYFLYGAEHLNLDNYYFDIPVVYNKAVKKWIRYFKTRGRDYFERYSARAGRYAPIMGKILEDYGLPRDLIFLAMAESGFQNKAKSWARAVGPWQFMPYTGKRYGLKISWYIDERRDPIKATVAAAKYLSKLYKDFGAWELAAAAYNAGEGKMSRAIRRYKTENFWNITRGRYLKPETKNYVPKIMALAIIGKNLKAFGFEEIDFYEPLDFEEVVVKGGTDLVKVAENLGVSFEEVQYLNPEVMRWYIPKNIESYTLRLPPGNKVAFERCCTKDDFDLSAEDFQEYRVRSSRSRLRDVARKFKIKAPYVLEDINGDWKAASRLKKGTVVKLPFREGQSKRANMYADLYERPRKSVLRRRNYRRRIKMALRRGKRVVNPTQWYTVQKGDTLWDVARKTGVSLDTLISSNVRLVRRRMIREGDRLAIR